MVFSSLPLKLEKVRIGHDNSGREPAWYLDEITIILRDQCWVLPCHDWLDENRGDTERILYPGIFFDVFILC